MNEIPSGLLAFATPCQHCPQHWVKGTDPKGGDVYLTAESDSAGNHVISISGAGVVQAGLLSRGRAEGLRAAGVATHLPHALTCVKPREWFRGPMPSRKYAKR